jgi:hypothetical protein
MEIGLENAIGAVHSAKYSGMKNGIITAGIMAGAGAVPNYSTFVLGDIESLFGKGNRIIAMVDKIIHLFGIMDSFRF